MIRLRGIAGVTVIKQDVCLPSGQLRTIDIRLHEPEVFNREAQRWHLRLLARN
jgi:hypothetical protein